MKCMCPECGYPNAKIANSGIECPEPSCKNYSGKFSQFVDAVTETSASPMNLEKEDGCGAGCGHQQPEPWANPDTSSDDDEEYADYEEEYYDDYEEPYDDDYDDRDGRNLEHIKVVFFKTVPRKNTVELQFCLAGEPGMSDKRIEFLFSRAADPTFKQTATLSNKRRTYVDAVDADGRTVYKTHWKCKEDGFDPTLAKDFVVEPHIF